MLSADNFPETLLDSAINTYISLRIAKEKYRKNHLDKFSEISRNHYYRMKQDPEKYAQWKEKCRIYQKKRRDEKKASKNLGESTESPKN